MLAHATPTWLTLGKVPMEWSGESWEGLQTIMSVMEWSFLYWFYVFDQGRLSWVAMAGPIFTVHCDFPLSLSQFCDAIVAPWKGGGAGSEHESYRCRDGINEYY